MSSSTIQAFISRILVCGPHLTNSLINQHQRVGRTYSQSDVRTQTRTSSKSQLLDPFCECVWKQKRTTQVSVCTGTDLL